MSLKRVYNKLGQWVKSRLRYYKGRQVIKEMKSERYGKRC